MTPSLPFIPEMSGSSEILRLGSGLDDRAGLSKAQNCEILAPGAAVDPADRDSTVYFTQSNGRNVMSDLTKLPQPKPPCFPAGVTDQAGKDAFILRFGTATGDAAPTGSVTQTPNTDLAKFPDGLGTYTKGLKQASPGIPDSPTFDQFLKACGIKPSGSLGDFQNPAIQTPGPRKLNGPRGAFALQLVGKDSSAFGSNVVPAAPALDSVDYAIELVELYWASLLRDVSFTAYAGNATAIAAAKELTALSKANPGKYAGPLDSSGNVTPDLLFRGGTQCETGLFRR